MANGPPCCNQFWLRKLHSITGFLFLGYFLLCHFGSGETTSSAITKITCLYLPLLFHTLYGLYVTYESSCNFLRYLWLRNWMYFAQRATGLFLVVFLALHLGDVRLGASYASQGWYKGVWYAGVIAAASHLANGTFGTLVDWGITVGPYSQRVVVGASLAGFLALCAYGLRTLYSY